MHEALNPRFQFDEGTVVGEADDLATDPRVDRVPGGHVGPGVVRLLFETKRDPAGLPVIFQNDHLHLIPDDEQFRWMADTPP